MSLQPEEVTMKRAYGTGSLYERNGVWWGRWRSASGSRPHRRIGPARTAGKRDGLTRREAEARLRDLMSAESPRHRDESPSVAAMGVALETRLAQLGRKKSHRESVESHLRVHINPFFEGLKIDEVDEQDVQTLMDRLGAKVSPKTIRNIIGTLHSVFDLAVRRKLIVTNPCQFVELPKASGDPMLRFLTLTELDAVLAAEPPDSAYLDEQLWWPVLRLLVLMAAMSGMRLGELLALTWADLDHGASKIRVRRAFVRGEMGTPKSKRSVRGVPLASRLLEELDSHHKVTPWNQDHDLILAHPYTGKAVDRSKALKLFKRACERAGVRQVRLHDLRHTFATTMAARPDVSLRTLQQWLGHRDLKTTMIYADYMPGDDEAQMVDEAFSRTNIGPTFGNSAGFDRVETQ